MTNNLPVPHAGAERKETRVRRDFWRKLKRNLGRIWFTREAVAAYYCALDPKTPKGVKATLVGALAYFILPTDMIPDLIAGLGFTDDATVLLVAIRSVASHIRPEHREKAAAWAEENDEESEAGDAASAHSVRDPG